MIIPIDAIKSVKLLYCPFCGTDQIQLIANYSCREHDKAKCRHCSATAFVKHWNMRVGKEVSE